MSILFFSELQNLYTPLKGKAIRESNTVYILVITGSINTFKTIEDLLNKNTGVINTTTGKFV